MRSDPACEPHTSRLPCVRGGGFASTKPEGLLPIPRPGCTDIFAPAVNPSVTAKPRQLPLHRGAKEQTPRQKIALSRRSGCTEETWAVQICTAEKLRQVKFLLPPFLFERKGGACFSLEKKSRQTKSPVGGESGQGIGRKQYSGAGRSRMETFSGSATDHTGAPTPYPPAYARRIHRSKAGRLR